MSCLTFAFNIHYSKNFFSTLILLLISFYVFLICITFLSSEWVREQVIKWVSKSVAYNVSKFTVTSTPQIKLVHQSFPSDPSTVNSTLESFIFLGRYISTLLSLKSVSLIGNASESSSLLHPHRLFFSSAYIQITCPSSPSTPTSSLFG